VNIPVLQRLIQPLLLAPGEQLLVPSGTHDFPTFLLNVLLETFPAAVILEDVGARSSISTGSFYVPVGSGMFPNMSGWLKDGRCSSGTCFPQTLSFNSQKQEDDRARLPPKQLHILEKSMR